jgi:hypothetical protein
MADFNKPAWNDPMYWIIFLFLIASIGAIIAIAMGG